MQQIDNVPVTGLTDFFGAGKTTHPFQGSSSKTVIKHITNLADGRLRMAVL